jgi:hypothetical protein
MKPLALILLAACVESHERLSAPVYVHFCSAMTSADQAAIAFAAAGVNTGRVPVLWFGHGEPPTCNSVTVCRGKPGYRYDGCVGSLRYRSTREAVDWLEQIAVEASGGAW